MSAFTLSTKKIITHTAKLNCVQLIDLLRLSGHNVPDDTELFIQVPGGGDYSNTRLDIDGNVPLHIEYTTVEQS